MMDEMVAGILTRNGKFLVEKRREDEDVNPGWVEIPGGHVEKGEHLESALKRELNEELGIEAKKMSFLVHGLATATNGETGRIHYFHVTDWEGTIVAREAEKVYWESEIDRLKIPSDRTAVKTVLKTEHSAERPLHKLGASVQGFKSLTVIRPILRE